MDDFKAMNTKVAQGCLDTARLAAKKGMAGHLSALVLSIRQVAFTNSANEDNRAAFAQYITEAAMAAKPETTVQLFCRPQGASKPGDTPCHGTNINFEELIIAMGHSFDKPTPAMNPQRNIPITKSLAAMNSFFDAIMTPENFLAQKQDGSDMSLAETVTEMRKKYPTQKSRDTMVKCLTNNTPDSLGTCALESARVGLAFRLEEGLDYSGSTFRGIRKPSTAPTK
jgi:hypothetical protein